MVNNQDTLAAEMQRIVRMAAEPRPPVDSSKGAINRAARALGITYRRARSFWYGGERALIREAEARRLREEHARLLLARIERMRREIADAERLLAEARARDAAAVALARRDQTLSRSTADAFSRAGCRG